MSLMTIFPLQALFSNASDTNGEPAKISAYQNF
jgi:hypothetical protein